ncbi:MAG: 9-O-acetylesterase [Actinobacteria bacterium]|nr:9-O-acetylesterase [Actinomycetota bacterium]
MRHYKANLSVILFLLFIIAGCSIRNKPAASIHLPRVFSDNMVLQREIKVPVWGTAKPRGRVTVQFGKQIKKTRVSDQGKWQIDLAPLTAGGPYEMKIMGQDTIIFKNVMVGEVWLCSGQSNMEMPLAGWGKVKNYEQEIAAANYPNIRLMQIEHTIASRPATDVRAVGWNECSPATIAGFSATAYFFGRELYKDLDIPIGLLHSSWGGTPVEAWTSANSLKNNPEFTGVIQAIQDNKFDESNLLNLYREKVEKWGKIAEQRIAAVGGYNHGWEKLNYNTKNWHKMKLPTLWETAGLEVDGVVWFRKEIDIPDSWKGQDLTLSLGPINDFDVTWFNGTQVGSIGHPVIPRIYHIPGELVKSGRNVVVVQVLDIGNKGGLYGTPKQMNLSTASKDSISLAGTWRYKTDTLPLDLKKLPPLADIPNVANRPTVLFNGMISPLLPFAIRGAIWYQGEANTDRAYQYRTLFKTLIRDWRSHWGEGDFPFLFVQLANFMKRKPMPSDDAWAELREAQLMALSLPNTGMAVTIDIGDAKDIHPKNKQQVGRRLALNARHFVYGEDVVPSGPIYKSMIIDSGRIHLSFDYVDGGLVIKSPGVLAIPGFDFAFAIAGADRKFRWARAKIAGKTVVVWHPDIKNPVAVRYAWASNPVATLYNKADLPAAPFRTDDWPGITMEMK